MEATKEQAGRVHDGAVLSISGAHDKRGVWATVNAHYDTKHLTLGNVRESRVIASDIEPEEMAYAKEIARRWNAHAALLKSCERLVDIIDRAAPEEFQRHYMGSIDEARAAIKATK